jgi:6-bladed beta-propeller
MSRFLTRLISLSCLIGLFFNLNAEIVGLNQKKGIWQNQKDKHIQFQSIEKIKFNFDKVPLKKVRRVLIHKNNIYILEHHRNELYVIDKKGKHLHTIGRPGQGPGDLEYPVDMFISNDDKIYVLNSLPRRIEIFSIKGESLGSIKLDSLEDPSLPQSLLVTNEKSFIISAPHDLLVSIYDSIGDYHNTILKRKIPVDYSKGIIGSLARLGFGGDDTTLHFDVFRGTFKKISKSGEIKAVFSAYDGYLNKKVSLIENGTNKKASLRKTMNYTLWSDFCIDNQNNIYVSPYSLTKKDCQPLFVFSPEGRLLYSKDMEFFKRKQIINIACDEESFVFRTHELNLYIAKRRK